VDGDQPPPIRRAPAYGADTERILSELAGLDEAAIAALKEEGVIEGGVR